jgi:hypothetical protein
MKNLPQEAKDKTFTLVEQHIGLDPDEQVLLLVRQHWVVFRNSALLSLFMPFVLLFIVFFINEYSLDWPAWIISDLTTALFGVSFIAFIVGGLGFMWRMYLWTHTFYVMTTKKLAIINKQKPWSYEVQQISLANINDVNLKQEGVESWLYGYSDVTAKTFGGSMFTFSMVGKPSDVQKAIMQQLALQKRTASYSTQID